MPTNKLRVMIAHEERHPYAPRKPSVAPIFKFILLFTIALILVIAAVAGTVLAIKGPISTDPIQRIHGGGK